MGVRLAGSDALRAVVADKWFPSVGAGVGAPQENVGAGLEDGGHAPHHTAGLSAETPLTPRLLPRFLEVPFHTT